ncbi:protein kinase domain-containing protein [Microsporum canis CBS 113480]|uniref:Protein kinase domain-containing protein n=1 Tax=Arthroderma otae (strain ATCC MYA-4605 / CBS 113480) TaxID=554155 RepID=C5FD84_ARTOC|nr:protein kinase domain-containing protein [Microsporum canis CBS 113480]EEQ27768.1 protein kinase domain-containing protein [Microsporum canis CBS 113480]
MGPATTLWTEAKIDFTVTREFVLKHVDPILHQRLNSKIVFGEGLTDDTYIDWILQRGRRLFLILVEIEVPSRIFRLVDETYDDSDLPFDSDKAELLRLSPDREDLFLNWKFVEAQNRFLARGIESGQHISYDEDETIPVEVCKERPPVVLSDRLPVEKVSLPGVEIKEYLRLKITIGEDTASHFLSESEVLREVRSLERFSHDHILSIFGTYSVNNTVNVLFQLPECTLRSFINERSTSALRKFSKLEQKRWLVNWPNCLANGLAWLHDQGYAHGAIRPSNILINAKMHISLGLFDVHDLLVGLRKEEFAEAYEYAAPEQWSNQHCAWQQPPAGTRNVLTRTDNLSFSPITPQKSSYDSRGRLTSWGSSSDFSSIDFGSTQPHCQIKQSGGIIGSLRSFDMSVESDIPIPPMPAFPEDYSCYVSDDKGSTHSNKLPNNTYNDSTTQLGRAETDSFTDLSNGSISLYMDDTITCSSSIYSAPLNIATPTTPAPPNFPRPWNVHIVNNGGEFDDKNMHSANISTEIIDEMMEDMHVQGEKGLPPLPVPTSHPWYVPSRVSSLFNNNKPLPSHTSTPLQHSYPDRPFEDSGLGSKPTVPPRHPNRPRANTSPNRDSVSTPRSAPDDTNIWRRSNSSFGSNNGGNSDNISPVEGITGRFSLLTSSRPSTSYGSSVSGLSFKKKAFMNFSRNRTGLRTPPPV